MSTHTPVRSTKNRAECSCGAYWNRRGESDAYLAAHLTHFQKEAESQPVHLLPSSCHVCGAQEGITGRPACAHDWTNAEALADARAHDARTTVVYSSGETTPEGQFVAETRGR